MISTDQEFLSLVVYRCFRASMAMPLYLTTYAFSPRRLALRFDARCTGNKFSWKDIDRETRPGVKKGSTSTRAFLLKNKGVRMLQST